MPRGWIAQPPMVDRVDEFMSSAEILAGGECCAGGSATPAPRAEPLGIERCGLRASAVKHRLASAASAACLRECASVQNAWGGRAEASSVIAWPAARAPCKTLP
jgi:hypothetical protein